MSKIKTIRASQILDSRGNPTVEAVVKLVDGSIGIGACPSGASIGSYEAKELRDNEQNHFLGRGVIKAVENVERLIAPALKDADALNQPQIDKILLQLDGTEDKSKLGANAILPVSIAVCKAAAVSQRTQLFLYINSLLRNGSVKPALPTPLFNIFNGGKHADGNVNIQEFVVIPASSKPYSEGLELGMIVYNKLKEKLKAAGLPTQIGDEGGFAPTLGNNKEALEFLKQSVESTVYKMRFDVFFGIDAAATTFYHNGEYRIKDRDHGLSSDELISFYKELISQYPLLYLEDMLSEDDWNGWEGGKNKLPDTIVVGDDLVVTNLERLQRALEKNAISGVIIKPNQIGTVSETLAVVEAARNAGLKLVVSHRSGETNDDFIADLSVGVAADYAKFGPPARGERVAKYNRLLHIEKDLKG